MSNNHTPSRVLLSGSVTTELLNKIFNADYPVHGFEVEFNLNNPTVLALTCGFQTKPYKQEVIPFDYHRLQKEIFNQSVADGEDNFKGFLKRSNTVFYWYSEKTLFEEFCKTKITLAPDVIQEMIEIFGPKETLEIEIKELSLKEEQQRKILFSPSTDPLVKAKAKENLTKLELTIQLKQASFDLISDYTHLNKE